MTIEEIKKLVKYPVKYDGQMYIWDAECNMILQIRGWTRLSYLENPEYKQDSIARFIADAINEKLTKES